MGVLLMVVLGYFDWFEVLWIGLVGDVGGEGGETVAVVVVVVPADTVPSPRFNDKTRITAFIDLLPEVDRGSVVEVGLDWILDVMPCPTLIARGLLYFLFIVATRGWVALVALAVVVPPTPVASSGGATDQRGVTMGLRPRGLISSGSHWMLPSSFTSARWVKYCSLYI
jgi:hypothetical protein